jgi:hypothetical protein
MHELIKHNFDITSYDKTLNGCSKRRLDFYFECNTHSIIVEVDEEQHIAYDTQCEENRTNEIFTDLADRPLVLIRFNPDKTKDRIGCFQFTQENAIILNKTMENVRKRTDLKLVNCPKKHQSLTNMKLMSSARSTRFMV